MIPTAIVPIRSGAGAKRRLSHLLGRDDRRWLVDDLFRHVVDVLHAVGFQTIVLSPAPLDDPRGADVWLDDAEGLNGALDRAVGALSTPVLIVHADLPAIAPDDVHALLEAPGDIVVARARDGGTNALLMRRPMRCSFGPSSALKHAIGARAMGYSATVVDRPGLALDVDDEASLSAASRYGFGRRASASLPRRAP